MDAPTGEVLTTKQHPTFNADKVSAEEKYDGYYMVVTNERGMPSMEIIETYLGLWEIETTFRITKVVLETRPVFVSLPDHINARFLVHFLALTILRLLQKQTGKLYSAERMVDCLKRICCSHEQANVYPFYYRSEISDAIGETLGIDFSRKRLRLADIKKTSAGAKT